MPSQDAVLSQFNLAIVLLVFQMDDFLDLKQSQIWPAIYRHQKSAQANSFGKKWQDSNQATSSGIRGIGDSILGTGKSYISSNDQIDPGTQPAFYKMGNRGFVPGVKAFGEVQTYLQNPI